MERVRAWLAGYSWTFVTMQNAALCQAKNALHKPTSDGHDRTKALWEAKHADEMTLEDATEFCRRCHKMAPFCFFNGNTFTAIVRDVIGRLNLPPDQAYVIRSLAGHIVAGVATGEEEKAFRAFAASMEK